MSPNCPPILGAEASTGLLALKVERGPGPGWPGRTGTQAQPGPEPQATPTPLATKQREARVGSPIGGGSSLYLHWLLGG